ncbi:MULTISPECIES: hypothetical protein [Vibrio]|uniref:hypothetical protein n=1 Tax=Vibrio TaxID=662 RepID=UPI0004E4363D|nr:MULTISPECIES: hypothetical protein [Vibrio]EHK9018836.1 hypothetical protein [Vibrio vulnificus]EGR1045565.1 hypothetical protein [Vibrio cholerae]EGR1072296.1 hypothetical protein [Vibrio cholerae]EHU4998557.1 hypothetical protein [Vibrio vulnificus]EKF9628343.1 hypothetical protein [Vibrio cholerae]
MNRSTMFGIMASLLGLAALIFTVMDGSHFPVIQWPYEAYQGLVFSFVWGFGVSATVGYLLSILVFIGVAVVCFAVGHKISRSMFGRG